MPFSAGYTPITTCSPRNFELVKSLGAAAAFDYRDPDCAAKIQQYANNKLRLIWDTISSAETAKFCTDLCVSGGRYGAIVRLKCPRDDVKHTYSLATTCFGEPFQRYGFDVRDCTADFEFMKKWVTLAEELLAEGKVKVHPNKVGKGWENVLEGIDQVRHDKVSGHKLVFSV